MIQQDYNKAHKLKSFIYKMENQLFNDKMECGDPTI